MEHHTDARGAGRRRRRHNRGGRIAKTCIALFMLAAVFAFLWYTPGLMNGAARLLSSFPPDMDSPSAPATSKPVDSISGADTDETEWRLILVNKWNAIPEQYDVELTWLSNGEAVDARIYPALQEMFDAARKDGIYPVVASGYRTTERQQKIMDEKIAAYEAEGYSPLEAKSEAEAWVAIPGTSEHQLGIAVDINADGIHSSGKEVYEWLNENGYRFGFILRYPPDKTEITGVSNEPWHYRYVGIDAAKELYQQGVCLEEYLEK